MWQLQKGACSAIKKGGFFRHQSLMAEQALFCNSPSTLTKRIFDMFCIFFFFEKFYTFCWNNVEPYIDDLLQRNV